MGPKLPLGAGYVVDFDVYLGSQKCATEEGLTYRVVMELLQPRNPDAPARSLGKGYHLYLDNYYSSKQLFEKLRDIHIRSWHNTSIRTWFSTPAEGQIVCGQNRGSWRRTRDGQCLYVVWKDSVDCVLLTTIHAGTYGGNIVERRSKATGGAAKEVPAPPVIPDSNKLMGGVNLFDQMNSFYAVLRKVFCWPMVYLFNFLETATTNSYILDRSCGDFA